MLKGLVTFIAGTILGAVGAHFFGMFGGFLGSIAGMVIGWWAAKRMAEQFE